METGGQRCGWTRGSLSSVVFQFLVECRFAVFPPKRLSGLRQKARLSFLQEPRKMETAVDGGGLENAVYDVI